MGLSFCPKAAPSGTCEEAGEESAKWFLWILHYPWPHGSSCDRFHMHCRKCTSDEPSQSHRYVPVLAYRQFDIIIFNHASLHLPNSPLSSCLVPRTPYSPFSLAQGMATRKSTVFAVDQADTWSWVTSFVAHCGSVIIFSTTSLLLLDSSRELHVLACLVLSSLRPVRKHFYQAFLVIQCPFSF